MSFWTHVKGMVEVEPLGCTQAEKRYILETVLNHLPHVSGSENDMKIYIIQKDGYNCSSSCDEFIDIISDNLQKESEILYMKNKNCEIHHICIKQRRKEDEK